MKNLPTELPVFPLSNFIIFPKTTVPLNIFEPRYIEMINDSMKSDKLIGMIQPKNILESKASGPEALLSTTILGCIMPINLSDFMLSLIISIYLGSKILSGTVVFGKIIKLLNGKIGIFFGKFIIIICIIPLKYK